MKELIVVFLMVAVIAVLLIRKKKSGEAAPTAARPAPVAQDSLKQELLDRMEDFLERDLFCLVVQPIVDFKTEATYSGEVLSRLHLPERGVVFPDQFLPAVNALGLYPKFDRYIFRKCCAWVRRSVAAGERIDCISCNFSRKTLSEAGLAGDLIQIADSFEVPRNKLGLEITEREEAIDARQFLENLKLLKAAGFRIILDDFGNGVTSVNDLMQYPLDIVKIDRSMLLNACTEKGREEFCELVTMATQLGMKVVCEGIETEGQNRFAREAGCHYGQGFLFFKPVSQDRVFEMMQKGSIFEDEL